MASSSSDPDSDHDAAAAILPAHIEATVQAIARVHEQHRQGAHPVQRGVDALTRFLGRPRSAGILALIAGAWIVGNAALAAAHLRAVDPPPYGLMQVVTSVAALFMMLFVLISQRREDELSELRGQLTLELAILSEQKTAKLIELIEELRRDTPSIHNRSDPEARALARPADPEAVLDALKEQQGAGG